jgi:hypothetical protein
MISSSPQRNAVQSRWGCSPAGVPCASMAAIFNLNHHPSYAHWHFFQMSVSNIIVIVVMLVVFVVAILAPFPSHGASGDSS